MKLDGIENLTDSQKKAIIKEYDADISALKKNHDKLVFDANAKKEHDDNELNSKINSEKMQSANTLEELKKLLVDERTSRNELEQRILDGEKERLATKNKQTVDVFVDKFVNDNVINDSLVRDAIKSKISGRLGVHDGGIVEFNGSELTGKTGEQILSEIKSDKGYANHLIANKSKGGGATGGGGNGTPDTKIMTRAEFDSAQPSQVAEFVRDGGNIVDSR